MPSCHFPSSNLLPTLHSPRQSRWPHPYSPHGLEQQPQAAWPLLTTRIHFLSPHQLGSATYTAYEWEVRNGIGHKWIVKKR